MFSGGGGFFGGGDDWITALDEIEDILPLKFKLSQNYPNPFNPSTKINYSLAEPSHVQLEIYNILGQRVAVLVDEAKNAGSHTHLWNANNIPSGVYFYRIIAGDFEDTRKMILIR
jgi:hypothetical protein